MAYTTIDDPSAHFQTLLYTGDGNDDRNLVNTGNSDLQPDFLWIKDRDNARSHEIYDSSRGATKRIQSDSTGAESTQANNVQAFQSDGFQVGSGNGVNQASQTLVAWQWKANGGTTTTNSSGTNITSTVQANTTAGFSIVTFTGTGNDGDSYGHGLNSAPELVIPKKRSGTSNWQGYAFDGGNSQYFYLNLENAFASTSGNSAASSSSVITTDGSGDSNPNGGTVVSYCFHSVQGYSKIGRYKGNGNADGTMIYTGFKPALFIVKSTNQSNQQWYIFDNKRDPINPVTRQLQPNLNDAENNVTGSPLDFLSNGIKIRNTSGHDNTNNGDYFYIAFAEHPFVSSEGVPTTAK